MRTFFVRYGIPSAVAAALAASANATPIASYGANQQSGANVSVYISGSTALDDTLGLILNDPSLAVCQAGSVNEYQDLHKVFDSSGNAIGGAAETLWYCQAGASSGVSTSKYLAVFKESAGGSINAVQSLIAAATGQPSGLVFLNPTGADVQSGSCANAQTGGTDAACEQRDFQYNVAPTGGISDLEAPLLRTIPGGGALSTGEVAEYLNATPLLDTVWGVAVTKNLYYALQTAEHLSDGTITAACDIADNDNPACAPSFSKEQLSSLFLGAANDGALLSWNQLIGISNSVDNNVYVCRLGEGSGLLASFDAAFLHARCASSSEETQTQDGQYFISQASAAGVRQCLQAFYTQGNTRVVTPYNQDYNTNYSPFTPAGNQWAIGVLSADLTAADLSNVGDSFRLVAVDGILPTLENAVNGFYPYFDTVLTYTIKSGQNVPTGDSLNAWNAILQGSVNTQPLASGVQQTALRDTDVNYAGRPWGDGGDLGLATLFANTAPVYASFPATHAEVLQNPVSLWTKASSGTVNNCDTPMLYGTLNSGLSPSTVTEGTIVGSGNVNQH